MLFQNKTYFITGASRGIGRAIALKLAAEGANIVIASKSVVEDERLGGTIYTVAEEVEKLGGQCLAVPCDIREESQIMDAVAQTKERFGMLHGVINNASAISLTNTENTPAKRFDLMHDINVRGTFLVVQHCLPLLKLAEGSHIITLSPPLNIDRRWLAPFAAYTLSKFNMSMLTIAWAAEFKKYKIGASSLWPVTTIATAAVQNLLGGETLRLKSRHTDIIAEAAHTILAAPYNTFSGMLTTDEEVLKTIGVTDFSKYAIDPSQQLQKDLFLD